MVLFRLDEFDAAFHKEVGDRNIKSYDVYSDAANEKVGNLKDILVDENGSPRYLVIDIDFWVTGKQVLLPTGRCRLDDTNRRIYAKGLTREQIEYLPEFDELERVNYDYEERVRKVYRTSLMQAPLETMTPLETDVSLEAPLRTEVPLEASAPLNLPPINNEIRRDETIHKQVPAYIEPREQPIPTPVPPTYTYQQEPDLYQINDQEHNTLKLYEERLIANKHRVKTGEVTIGKHVETETARVSIPVDKERVIIERTTPAEAGRVVSSNEATFGNQEFVHMDIYEETPDIQKQIVVREEVEVRKVVEHDTVEAQEKVRREELDVNTDDGEIKKRRN